MTPYTLSRSNRKTVGLYVKNGALEVRAPAKMPKPDIDRFVKSKEKWIKEKLSQSCKRKEEREAFALNYGDSVMYRGAAYPVAARPGMRVGFDGKVFYLPQGLAPDDIKYGAVQVYRLLAKRHLKERTAHFAGVMGVMPSAVKITGAKTRWGSCSTGKSLNYSWRLVMADDEVIDYVVVHELAHITEMNHQDRFWAIVEKVLPNYKELRARLKELQKQLGSEDWD
ncbi:MAG: M48 family metallopeptidase [Clostridiales bacterium]|nr:M48 family metallopeptidase [Clostridiales bacterium]